MPRRIAQEGEQPLPRLFQAVRHAPAAEPPLGQEGLALLAHLLGVFGVHHVGVVGLDLVVQRLRRMGEEVALLVHRAALHRNIAPQAGQRRLQALAAVYDQKLRRLQATAGKVLQDMAPGRLGLPAHVLDREQNLLAVPPHPKHDQQRD